MGKWLPGIRDGMNFAGTLSFKKIINIIRVRLSFYFSILLRKPLHWGGPESLSVEPTTSCNLRCPECPSGLKQFSRPEGKMPMDKYRSIIDQIKDQLVYLLLYFQGEPMLNPSFFDMISYASKNRIYTATSTNGHFLGDDNARKIVESGLDRMIISIDGIDQETYEKYRRGGDLGHVLEGVQHLVSMKKQLGSLRPFIILQFLVFKSNEHQIPEMRKLARQLRVDRLEFKTAQVYDFANDNGLIPDNPKYSRYIKGPDGKWKLKRSIRNRCLRMWSGAVVTWDGMVVPCCFDKDATHPLGHLNTKSFKEIWKSKGYRDFRAKILSDRSSIDICRNCTE